MGQMNIAGETFEVAVDGPAKAPALLFSNSLGCDLSMWDAQAKALKRDFRIIRYDSRGHGRSTAPRGPYSIERLGLDALAILDTLKVKRAHFCGLSKGGMVGQWLASHHGERLGKVVLANTAARMGPPDLWNDRIQLVRKNGLDAIVGGTMERWFSPRFRSEDAKSIARVAAMFTATPVEGYVGCCAAIRDMDQSESIRAIRNPVLVIVGRNDPATTPAVGRFIKERIRGAKLAKLPAAHLSAVETPAAFTELLGNFLQD
jgi:3-oxoadipate enol-lactonase